MTELARLGNWGKWGEDDERGALNRITAEATRRALASVRTGFTVSLGLPLRSGKGPLADRRAPLQHFMMRDGGDYAAGLNEHGFGFADDAISMPTGATTHLDALAHVWSGHRMWNGFSADSVTSRGASRCGIDKTGPIVTRGVFIDVGSPSGPCSSDDRALSVDDLAAAISKTGVTPRPGDALIVRTGWLARWRAGTATEKQWAGLHPNCAEWIDEQGFALVGADNLAVEQGPSTTPEDAAPMHVALMRDRGVHLLELMDLEQLAIMGRTDFLLVVAPLRLVGGIASPVNPIAVL